MEYVRILATIGTSREALSSHELIHEMVEKGLLEPPGNKDVIRKLKMLNPLPFELNKSTYLIDLRKLYSIKDNEAFICNIFRKISRIFELEWDTDLVENRLKNDLSITQNDKELIMILEYGSESIVIGIPNELKYETRGLVLHLRENRIVHEETLIVVNKDGINRVYIENEVKDRIWYLNITLSQNAKKLNPLLDRYWDYVKNFHNRDSFMKIPVEISYEINNNPECMKIINNSRYWKYSLNPRGFVLFLIGESKFKSVNKKGEKRIREVLSNHETLKIAPFLKNWDIFEQIGFDVINTLRNIGRDFENHVYIKDFEDEDLVYMITERYSDLLEQYLAFVHMYSFPANISLYKKYKDLDIENIRKRYLLEILNKQKHYLDQKVSAIEEKLSLLA